MKDYLSKMDERSRRDFISALAKTSLGVSASFLSGCGVQGSSITRKSDEAPATPDVPTAPATQPQQTLAESQLAAKPTAKSVIYIYLAGGMTHVDTFDPKPGKKDVMGPTEAIKTSADGVMVGHWLEKTARHMDKIAVINSLSTTQGAHAQGNYFMHTSYTQRASIRHPRMGTWVSKLSGPANVDLPASVFIGSDSVGGGAGFMPSKYGALGIGDPEEGLQNSKRPNGVSDAEFKKRMALTSFLDTGFHGMQEAKQVQAYTDMYTDALRMMNSEDLKGFNIQDEPESMKKHYGDSKFGKGALLARRLVEHGVRFVELSSGGWDMHNNIQDGLEDKMADFDQAYSALISDLAMRGMLEETMVVVATEFGRTPEISSNAGRNHFPQAFSCTLAGGGIQGGQKYGKTDDEARKVIENKVSVPDFNATIAYAMGLPYNEIVYSPSKRPFTVADTGTPLVELFG